MEFRRFTKGNSRQILNFSRIQDSSGVKRLVCLDEGFILICQHLANTRGLFRTTYHKGYEQSGYYIPSLDEFNLIENLVAEGITDMAGCGDIVEAINNLTTATQNQGGCDCGSTGGAGTFEEPPAPFTDNGSDWPEGYLSYAEYQVAKCNLTRFTLDRISADLARIQTLDLVGLSLSAILGGIGLAILVPMPAVQATALAIALGAVLTALGSAAAVIQQAIDYVDGLDVCLIYNASNVTTAVSNVQADIQAQTFPVADGLTKDILVNWFTTDSLNVMFSDKPSLTNLPVGDCSGCGVPQWWDCSYGTVITYDATSVTVEMVPSGSDWFCSMQELGRDGFLTELISGTHTLPGFPEDFVTAIENSPADIGCGTGAGGNWDSTSPTLDLGSFPAAEIILYRSGSQLTIKYTKI